MDVVSRITDTSTPEEVALVVRHLSQGRARVNGSFGGRTLRLLDDDILDDYFIWDDDASSEDRQDFINRFWSSMHPPVPTSAVPFTCGSLATMAGRVASVYLEANPRGRAAPYAIVSVSRAHSLAHHGDVVHVAAYERAGLFDPEQQVPLPGALPELDERASG
ncbi:unnamed protein product (mitochondrion) [Plasmodiophora brassicae]|uniref:Uncharacterized protein n=1 Tax=Plasmodiophora brassicae TaxID=37360 RepID=A0A0G4IX24_PLABS|nr:hypothetical protein PBRA_007541 [Plasmodiophora brassicae]SPR02102.1 unnamed protein product [Plasmodiophora brassicae]